MRRQCALVGVARSGVYRHKPVAEADDLAVMRRIDELHLELPFYGSRRMTFELDKEGRRVNRKRVRRLMRVMGIEALVPRPGTSNAALGRKIYPYLLRGLKIVEPNHVWAADVTYIPMACGFLYLVAIIDWASRAVLAWRLSNTNDASFCAAALGEALLRFGKPRQACDGRFDGRAAAMDNAARRADRSWALNPARLTRRQMGGVPPATNEGECRSHANASAHNPRARARSSGHGRRDPFTTIFPVIAHHTLS